MIVMEWCLLMSREAVSFVSFLCYDGDGVVFLDVAGGVDRGRGYRGIGHKQTNFLLLSVIRNGKNIRDLEFFCLCVKSPCKFLENNRFLRYTKVVN